MCRNSLLVFVIALAACTDLPTTPRDNTTGGETTGGATGGTTTGGGTTSAPITYTGPTTQFLGRTGEPNGNTTLLSWSSGGVDARWTGTTITATLALANPTDAVEMDVYMDGTVQSTPITVQSTTPTQFPINANSSGTHEVRLIKRTEAGLGEVFFSGFTPDSGSLMPTQTPSTRRIEVIGDSITCGFGVLGFTSADGSQNTCPANNAAFTAEAAFENSDQSYATLLAQQLNAELSIVAWSGKGVAINDDGTTTQTIPALYPFDDFTNSANPTDSYQFPSSNTPDVVVINLGTNDFSASKTANPSQTQFVSAYVSFVQMLRGKYPNAKIFLCGGGPMLSDFFPSGLKQATTSAQYVQQVISQLGDANMQFVQIATQNTNNGTGCLSHPLPSEQQAMATQLAGVVQKAMGW